LRQPDANGYTDAYGYADGNGDGYAYSDRYSPTHAHAETSADAKAASNAATAAISSPTISWLDSGTRERKLASSCLWMESAFYFSELSMFPIKGLGPREKI
jgi:hypothetical protein